MREGGPRTRPGMSAQPFFNPQAEMRAEILFIPSTSAPAPAPLRADLNVAVVPAADSAGFFVALHEGLFAARGLHVKFMPAISPETVINAQAPGEAMEALPAPLGLTKVQAAVMALDAYPVGPRGRGAPAARGRRMRQFPGFSPFNIRSMLMSG